MMRALAALALLMVALAVLYAAIFFYAFFWHKIYQFVTQEERSTSGDLYYTYFESYISNTSPYYLVRVPSAGGDPDTLYSSRLYFDFRLSGDSVSVTTCSRDTERKDVEGSVEVIVDEEFDCRTNREVINRR